MIDKIDSHVYNYPNNNMNKSPALRAYENTPTARPGSTRLSGKNKADSEGVILDLSSKSEKKIRERSSRRWLEGLQRLFHAAALWLKAFWETDGRSQKVQLDISADKGAKGTELPAMSETDRALYELLQGLTSAQMNFDELDTAQVSLLMDAGVDIEAAEKGNYNYQEVLDELEIALGLKEEPGADAAEDSLMSGETVEMHPQPEETAEVSARDMLSRVNEAVQSGSLSRLEEALTENGRKKLAHNSDLLTYYDRKGQLVEIDDTEKHRVLYGDRNILKL